MQDRYQKEVDDLEIKLKEAKDLKDILEKLTDKIDN